MNSEFFETFKGVRQGDPASPMIFNLVADVFSRTLNKASKNKMLSGLTNKIFPQGIIGVQYADDTLLFLENNIESAKNIKWLLACFEQMSGLRINFHKCHLVPINTNEEEAQCVAQALSCGLGSFPLKYLGFPLHHSKLRREDLQPVVDKVLKRLLGGEGDY